MPPLEFDELRRAVKKGEIRPAYYFHGNEDLLKDDALRDLLAAALDPSTRDFNLDRRRAADLTADEFSTLSQTPPMLAARRAVVVTEIEALQQRRTRAQELRAAIVRYLERPASDTVLVLVQSASRQDDKGPRTDPDLSRLAASVAFESLRPDKLQKWIRYRASKEGLEIDEAAALHLHAAVGDDLGQLSAEIVKLKAAVGERAAGTEDVSALVGVRRGETVYDFQDAVIEKRFTKASEMVPHLLSTPGSSGVRILSGLATALVGVALARALLDRGTRPRVVEGQLLEALKSARPPALRKWGEETRRWTESAEHWSRAELDTALSELLRADRRLKDTTLGGEAELLTEAVLAMALEGQVA